MQDILWNGSGYWLLSDGCCREIDEGLGPVTLQVVTREKPCAGMQGSKVNLQWTGTVTGHLASNIIHAYSIMPICTPDSTIGAHTCTHTEAVGCRLRLLVFQSESQSMGNKGERDFSHFFRRLLYLFVQDESGNVQYYSNHLI